MNGLSKGEYKTNRKMHNQIFKYRQLKFYQYSKVVVGDTTTLNIYVYKWFIVLIAIPMLLYGSFVIGFIPTFKELIELWEEPVSFDSLRQIPDGLLKLENTLPPQSK
ncbi:hypothetical protein [Xenorhabdus bovienii]|uniref:hypothetical protein n=1 Tax=Xenorhabdus bovienii TaxID=40576 RepID=UPI0023B2E363|nr:hypothetical protein [Xenorhabdus bovienii]MDE9467374.1 hypothetical protein [Xenorhabdus bovienii]